MRGGCPYDSETRLQKHNPNQKSYDNENTPGPKGKEAETQLQPKTCSPQGVVYRQRRTYNQSERQPGPGNADALALITAVLLTVYSTRSRKVVSHNFPGR
jgi:hypothetical protein